MIQKLEELTLNGFPAISNILLNGWVLRFSNGYTKRANSVNPIYPCSIQEEENIRLCEMHFDRMGLQTVFKLTDSDTSVRLDGLLAARGYRYDAKTNVMLLEMNKCRELEKIGLATAALDKKMTEEWIDAYLRINNINHKNLDTIRCMLNITIPEKYFASIRRDGEIIAVGLGVAQDGYVGMYDISVHQDHRRKGLGTAIMKSLFVASVTDGIAYSYLQVVDENHGAKQLYQKLGYEKQYSYWYRIREVQQEG